MSMSKEKVSASIVEQVHDNDDVFVLTVSCNSGVYDNKWLTLWLYSEYDILKRLV